MNEIPNDLKCMTFSKNDISRIENDAYNKGRTDAIDEIWKGVVEEYDNDYCPCVDDYMDYQVTLREIDKILRRMKESKE